MATNSIGNYTIDRDETANGVRELDLRGPDDHVMAFRFGAGWTDDQIAEYVELNRVKYERDLRARDLAALEADDEVSATKLRRATEARDDAADAYNRARARERLHKRTAPAGAAFDAATAEGRGAEGTA